MQLEYSEVDLIASEKYFSYYGYSLQYEKKVLINIEH